MKRILFNKIGRPRNSGGRNLPGRNLASISGIRALFCSQRGSTLIEIALYAALVVIVCIAVVAALGEKLQGVFSTVVNSL